MELDDRFVRWIGDELGGEPTNVTTIGSGASRRIWSVDVGSRGFVVREDTGDGPVAGTALSLAREAAVYRALAGTDLPVPTLRSVSPDGCALLLDRARGDERFDSCTDAERDGAAADYGRCLARLHLLDPSALDLGDLAVGDRQSATAADVELWRSIHETRTAGSSSPPVPVALDWLAGHLPAPTRTSLCHGDAGPGNFLHAGGRVTAMHDWEFAHLGDPHDDLAWVAVRNQVLRRPLDVSTVFRAWCGETGRELDTDLLEWFRALVLTRMLISCDASIAWAGDDRPPPKVQLVLRPFLALAVVEALGRAGCADPFLPGLADAARRAWEGSPVAGILDDPSDLDDLGAFS